MTRIVVIADDITGAAEIAGIAHRYGLKTILTTSAPSTTDGADVIVVATDARSYGPDIAARMTAAAKPATTKPATTNSTTAADRCLTVPPSDIIFHKVDSALRGNVQAQLAALGGEWLYMPANPSKGRIIRNGVYYITTVPPGTTVPIDATVPADFSEGPSPVSPTTLTPLHATDFRFDPEFPAWSSRLDERFPGLEYANAETKADVDRAVERALAEGKQLAGAADLFCSLIEHIYHLPPTPPQQYDGLPYDASMLVVRGSTQSKSYDLGLRVESMPLDVFYEQAAPVTWSASIIDRYRRSFAPGGAETHSGAILTIGDKEVRQGKDAAVYLRNAMAEVCCTLLAAHTPDNLIIEGGATAYAIISQLPYSTFRVTAEIAPGVVQLTTTDGNQPTTDSIVQLTTTDGNHQLSIILKPGSYSWGSLFAR